MTTRTLANDRAPAALAPVANRLAFDRASDREMDADGRMHVRNCILTKATVNDYYGWEIPGWEELGLERYGKYGMLRDPDALEEACKDGRFDGIPLQDEHKDHEATTHEKRKTNIAGSVSAGCFFDGEYVRTPLLSIWGEGDIKLIESEEKCELSSSYAYDPVMKPGEYKGLRYHGRMVNIRPNHVALVERGRAGRDVKVSDALPKGLRMKKKAFRLFTATALSRFTNDADISTEELVDLLSTAAKGEGEGGGADDDDLTPDPNAMDGMPEELRGKLTDDEWSTVANHFKPKAQDEGKGEEGEGEEGEGEEGDGKGKANDRRPRANDAEAIRRSVVRDMSRWQTACEKVAPHIGKVRLAMDAVDGGAATLYRRALTAHGIDHTGVRDVVALERMVDMIPTGARPLANDADPANAGPSPLDGALKGAGRIIRS